MRRKALIPLVILLFLTPLLHAEEDSQGYQWDLSDLYPSVTAWEEALEAVEQRIAALPDYQGTLGDSPAAMAEALSAISDSYKEAGRVFVYASLSRDEDQRDADAQARFNRARQVLSDWDEATAWLEPDVLALGEDRVEDFLTREDALDDFSFMLRDILRQAPHTLDGEGEALLANADLALSMPGQIYENYANADIPWPSITLDDGTEAELDQSGYTRWRGTADRDDRKKVFDTFWSAWEQYADGMGATLAAEVQSNVFFARAREHDSVLSQNLFDDGLPPEIYTELVDQVNEALPLFHRYLDLRAEMLDVEDLRYYDIYPPLVEVDPGEFSLERSKQITLDALAPFGEEYLDLLRRGFSQDWMHSHPQPGKASGAYMNGSAYDVHPYVLLNHNGDYESLSTFAHEWGHAVHSLLANANNPWETASYSTFIAEMASTINEILLEEHMIANAETREEKLYYLGYALESLRGTLFRQTMFAEFELAIHRAAEDGEPLTGSRFSEIYGELLKKYHGHDEGVLTIDELYTQEWAYIPHFYRDFYVFQYATSISGAAWFAERFLAGEDDVRKAFLQVLEAGGSDHPHNILREKAGLDMTQPEAYEPVMRRMRSLMDRIEALL